MTVQLHHADAYGILFFPNQLRFCHDVFQAWLASVGMPLARNRSLARFVAVVVHAESDYQAPVELGDQLEIRMRCASIGTTSFTHEFIFSNQHGVAVGSARVVMVTIDPDTTRKMPIPGALHEALAGNP